MQHASFRWYWWIGPRLATVHFLIGSFFFIPNRLRCRVFFIWRPLQIWRQRQPGALSVLCRGWRHTIFWINACYLPILSVLPHWPRPRSSFATHKRSSHFDIGGRQWKFFSPFLTPSSTSLKICFRLISYLSSFWISFACAKKSSNSSTILQIRIQIWQFPPNLHCNRFPRYHLYTFF